MSSQNIDFVELLNEILDENKGAVFRVPVHYAVQLDRYKKISKAVVLENGDMGRAVNQPLVTFIFYLLWMNMNEDTVYELNYGDLLRALHINYQHRSDATLPDTKTIRGILYRMGKAGLIKLEKHQCRCAVFRKIPDPNITEYESLYFHLNDLRLMVDKNLAYHKRNRLLHLLVLIKFNMKFMNDYDGCSACYTGYRQDLIQTLNINMETLDNYLNILVNNKSIFVYPQELVMINNKFRMTKLIVRDAGTELAGKYNNHFSYDVWN